MSDNYQSALLWLKSGSAVARSGWNGKGMWLKLIKSHEWDIAPGILDTGTTNGNELKLLPWIGMKTAGGEFVPWLASQTDQLADDWQVVELRKV